MSKMRFVNTNFWSDNWVVDELNPLDRYLFIYMFTNPHTNIAGVYQLSLRIMSFETGISRDELLRMMQRLQPKIGYIDGWVILRNGIKNQNYRNSKIKTGILMALDNVPSEILQHIKWPADFGSPKPNGSKQEGLFDNTYMPHEDLLYSDSDSDSDSDPNVTTVFELKPVDNSTIDTAGLKKLEGRKYSDVTALYDDLHDLVNDRFKAWYCSAFFKIGRPRVTILAAQAKADGNNPIKLFSHLLQKESGERSPT
jgi:hypothetical protein